MTGSMNVDLDRIRVLASQFSDHVETLDGLGGHDSADHLATGLSDTGVGSACGAAADATQCL